VEIEQSAVLGEPGTGYEDPEGKGPFACSNCEYFKDNSCGQKIMMAKSKRPKLPNGRVKVNAAGCCEYVHRIGRSISSKKWLKPSRRSDGKAK
jgi:hypothetical protein